MNFALLQQAQQGSPFGPIILFGGMALLFYFLLIRPQSKARKQMEERLSKLKAGDEVLLTSGFYAVIDRVEDKNIYLKLGSSIVKARRTAVASLAAEPAPEQN
ncbi:preprotein translocase subunit YajC [Geothrix sp. 21YS21S-2]|jgi:preprotein translocase subunit YajC|uniref:preprotein translocase subunit YajC n=1 Tax=Geothrix sp. 21YS21S-2 TaxID=3068893 RepID=UPI001ED6886C|nr:preprotein translocase subunit YajC [Geothrix sp. 21YS21S-2]NTV75918.1 preprotein translocase subunit YajC [Holophaga sp.]